MKLIKLLTFLIIALFSISLNAQELNEERLSMELLNTLEEAPDRTHSVYVSLADHLDVRALENELIRRKASLHERAYEVVTQLQAKAASTQPVVIQKLKTLNGVKPESIQPFWAANVIFFEAGRDDIAAISRMEEIEYIDLNWEIEFFDMEQEGLRAAPLKMNTTETGLVAIGATQMWEMGYTGYGRTCLIVDTGEDHLHPALYNNYAYHNRPEDESWASPGGPQACDNDHGTHVTGTAVGIDRILRDTIGVAYEGEWMGGPIPLFECFYETTVLDAFGTFQWALNPDGDVNTTDDIPDVINNSWGRPNPAFFDCNVSSVTNIYDALMAAGVAVVYAAGNEGPGVSTVTSPAFNNYDLVRFFSVGNLNANDPDFPIANGSGRGPTICSGTGSLKIKPEVSAPGTNVRSAVFNGNYASYSGTSMASPHVAGAIMILKEAFPYLSGEDIMLALYFSAIDLGEVGEDNTYGMGIINLPAAFQYLVDEGNDPVAPVAATNDLVLLRSEVNDLSCLEGVQPFIEVENIGTETVTSILVTCYFSGSQNIQETYEWEVSLLPEGRAETLLPPMQVPAGEYELVVELTEANGAPDNRILNNRIKRNIKVIAENKFEASILGNAQPCTNGMVALQSAYDGEAIVQWYDEPTGGNLLGEGPNVVFEAGASPFTAYMQVTPIEKLGKEDDSTGNIQFSDDDNGLLFNTEVPVLIRTVKVYAESDGGRIIRLERANGGVASKVVSLEEGENIVELDFSVPRGEGHRLYLSQGGALAFSLGGTNYPYEVSNVIQITGPSAGSGIFYHYFFDWEIEYVYTCGRTAVEVDVQDAGTLPSVSINPSAIEVDLGTGENEVTFNGSSDDAVSWLWDFGDGTTSTEQNPVHAFNATGTYYVVLTVEGTEGCSNSALVLINVVDNVISSAEEAVSVTTEKIMVYPNPTTDEVFLQFEGFAGKQLDYYLVDMFGRMVSQVYQAQTGQEIAPLSLSALPSGTYMLIVATENGRQAKKIIKQ
jgi:subtilisin family serine protease